MKSTFRVLFYLKKNAANKGKDVMIMTRITVDRKICQFSTKTKINPKNWSVPMGRAIGRANEANEINNLLEGIKTSLYSLYNKMLCNGDIITPEKIKERFFGHSETSVSVLEYFDKHNEDYKTLVGISRSLATYQKYELTKRYLTEFINYRYKMSDMPIRDIDPAFVNSFDMYLRTICRCSNNTVTKFMQRLKHVIILAKDNAIIQADPFSSYKMVLQKVDRGYLTEDGVALITKKQFCSERLELVRDIFVFAIFTGLAYIDVKNLKKNDIRSSFDGKLWIMTKRQKTDIPVRVPLMSIPQMIIEKYKDKMLNDNRLLPVISNQKLNSYLKEMADICGINKNLTFHLARHTFATTTTLSQGIPIETVSKMLGHTKIVTTQIYARITDNKIGKDMEGLSEKFSGIENLYKEAALGK